MKQKFLTVCYQQIFRIYSDRVHPGVVYQPEPGTGVTDSDAASTSESTSNSLTSRGFSDLGVELGLF